jgi:hypothetical protein
MSLIDLESDAFVVFCVNVFYLVFPGGEVAVA